VNKYSPNPDFPELVGRQAIPLILVLSLVLYLFTDPLLLNANVRLIGVRSRGASLFPEDFQTL